jgi:hypothetical protein
MLLCVNRNFCMKKGERSENTPNIFVGPKIFIEKKLRFTLWKIHE